MLSGTNWQCHPSKNK